jgi:hypothetical protein
MSTILGLLSKLKYIAHVCFFVATAMGTVPKIPPAEKLPQLSKFPDPLLMLDGTTKIVSTDVWTNKRRYELKQLFQHYMYGKFPPVPSVVDVQIDYQNDSAFNNKATVYQLKIQPYLKKNFLTMLYLLYPIHLLNINLFVSLVSTSVVIFV